MSRGDLTEVPALNESRVFFIGGPRGNEVVGLRTR